MAINRSSTISFRSSSSISISSSSSSTQLALVVAVAISSYNSVQNQNKWRLWILLGPKRASAEEKNQILTLRILFCNHWTPMANKSVGRRAQSIASDMTRNVLINPWRLTCSAYKIQMIECSDIEGNNAVLNSTFIFNFNNKFLILH